MNTSKHFKKIKLNYNTFIYYINLSYNYKYIFNDITRIQGIKVKIINKS
jgi:hypothetical protein